MSTSAHPSGGSPSGHDTVRLPPGRMLALADRGRTLVRELRDGTERPVALLLHGWTATADLNWYRTYDDLFEIVDVVAFDQRGHGRGITSRAGFSLETCADDATTVLDTLDIDRAVVVGYSMGGAIAQLLWRRHPDRVRALVLCATAATFNTTRREWGQFAALGTLAAAGRAVPRRIRSAVGQSLLAGITNREHRRWARSELDRHDWLTLARAGRALGRFDSRRWIHSVDRPTACIVTSSDHVVPTTRQRELAGLVEARPTISIAAHHSAAVTRPELFVPALVRAVGRVLERSR